MAQLQSTGITGSLTVTGNITAQEFHTEYVSSSILHESGSTSFGNTSDDVHNFTGSLNVQGSINATSGYGHGLFERVHINNLQSWSAQDLGSASSGSIAFRINGRSGATNDFIIHSNGTANYTMQVVGNAETSGQLHINPFGGNVGIGTTSPTYKLHVVSNTTPVAMFTGGNNAYVDFSDPSSSVRLQNSGHSYFGTQTNTNLNFKTNGSEKMTILAGGNVGIGTTNPLTKFDVRGSTFVTGYLVGFDTSPQGNYAYRLTNDSANSFINVLGGNLGIGTTNPNVPLEVHGADITTRANTTAQSVLRLVRDVTDSNYTSTKDSAVDFMLSRQQTVNNNLPYTRLDIRLAGTTDSSTPSLDVMSLLPNGNVGIGTTSPGEQLHVIGNVFLNANSAFMASYNNTSNYHGSFKWAGLQLGNNGTNRIVAGRTNTGGSLQFWTNNTNDASNYAITPDGTLTMIMTETGKVGIGTSIPGSTLQVGGGTSNQQSSVAAIGTNVDGLTSVLSLVNQAGNNTDGNGTSIDFHNDSGWSATGRISVTQPTATTGVATNSKMLFSTYGTVGGSTTFLPRMAIDYKGDVGIGTTSPDYKLEVQGQIAARKGLLSAYGVYTDGGTYTNQWQKVFEIPYPNVFAFAGFKLLITQSGDTSNVNMNAEVHINYKFQSNNGRINVNIVNFGELALTEDDFEVYRDNTNTKLVFYHRVTRNYSRPYYTLLGNTDSSMIWSNTIVGASLSGQANDAFTEKNINNTINSRPDTGNIGIGTTSPGSKLEISGSAEAKYLHVDAIAGNAGIGSSQGSMVAFDNSGDGHTLVVRTNNSSRTDASPFSVWTQTNSRLLIKNDGNVGIGTSNPASKLEINGDTSLRADYKLYFGQSTTSIGSWTTRQYASGSTHKFNAQTFIFNNEGYSSTEFMRIKSDGNVGIGTTSPLSKLTIDAPVGDVANGKNAIRLNYDGGSSPGNIGGGIVFSQKWWSASTGQQVTGGIFGEKHGGNGSYGGGLTFYTQPNGAGNMVQHMVIRSTGEVGIGTDSPTSKLEVAGRISGGELGNSKITRNGLSLYVDFNDKACVSGTSATEEPTDLGPNQYNLTLYGGANFEYKGGIGTYYFDGSADHINVNDFVVADTSNTYEFWHWANAQNGWETIWDSGTERPLLGTYDSNLRAYPNATNFATIDTGKWYHLVFAFASDSNLDIYVNGNKVADSVNWGNNQRLGTFQAWLGGDTGAETTNGFISIARTYTRQLNADDVLQNFNAEVDIFATQTPSLGIVQKGGKVGIGTNVPNGKLDIQYDMDVDTGGEKVLSSSKTQYGSINFTGVTPQSNGTTATTMQGLTWQVQNYQGTTDYGVQAQLVVGNNGSVGTFMGFFTSANYSIAPIERIRIQPNGYVGIGTTNPNEKLQLAGNLNAYDPNGINAGLFASTAAGSTTIALRSSGVTHFNGGNVGIGTTNPSNKLTIASGTGGGTAPDSRTQLYIDKDGEAYISINSPADSFNGLRLSIANSVKAFMELYDNTAQGKKLTIGTVDARDLVFDTTNLERMRILSGGNVGIGTTNPSVKLDVNGGISSRTGTNSAYSVGVLEISDGGTPTQVKITTAIPFSGTTNAHSIKISGFQYGSANTVDLQISWHVYNNSFYNRAITSSGGWAPTVTLAVENGYVVVHLLSPGYWPKMYVESLYNAFGSSAHAQGWSWSDAAISGDSGKPVQTVPYKANFGNSFLMDSNGNVGIGTTSPNYMLDVLSSAIIGSRNTVSSTVNYENKLVIAGKNNYSDGTTWYGNYGQILLSSNNNMTGSARRFLITNALDNNKFAIIRSVDANTSPVTNSTSTGVNSGTADFIIDSSGKVGIGTTSPEVKLQVEGSIQTSDQGRFKGWHTSGSGLALETGISGGNGYILSYDRTAGTYASSIMESTGIQFVAHSSGKFYFTGGNVGIGTTSPLAKLQVGLSTSNNGSDIAMFGGAESEILSALSLVNTLGNSAAGYGTALDFHVNSAYSPTGRIATIAESTATPAALAFYTYNSGLNEKMRITSAGNVGIGTDTPGEKLDVVGNIRSYSAAGNYGQIQHGSFLAVGAHGGTFMLDLDNTGTADLVNIKKSGSSKFYIKNDGNVGIGTTNPSNKLSLAGSGQNWNTSPAIKMWDSHNSKGWYVGSAHNYSTGDFYIRAVATEGAYPVAANQEFTIKQTGKVGIGTINPGYTLEVNAGNGLFVGDGGAAVLAADPNTGVFSIGDTDVLGDGVYMTNTGTSKIDIYADGSVIFRVDVNGNVHADGDVVAFSTTVSDKRLKDNILTIGDPLGKIKALRGVEYDWNNGSRKGQHDLGLIAQEVEEVLPMLVREHEMPLLDGAEDGTIYKTVDYEKLVALLVEGMKEQQETIDKLEDRIKKLENR